MFDMMARTGTERITMKQKKGVVCHYVAYLLCKVEAATLRRCILVHLVTNVTRTQRCVARLTTLCKKVPYRSVSFGVEYNTIQNYISRCLHRKCTTGTWNAIFGVANFLALLY